jgi:hypothetical protein
MLTLQTTLCDSLIQPERFCNAPVMINLEVSVFQTYSR